MSPCDPRVRSFHWVLILPSWRSRSAAPFGASVSARLYSCWAVLASLDFAPYLPIASVSLVWAFWRSSSRFLAGSATEAIAAMPVPKTPPAVR
jgi:hypothetical protein